MSITIADTGAVTMKGNDGRDYEWFYSLDATAWAKVGEIIGTSKPSSTAGALRAHFEVDRTVWSLMEWFKQNDIEHRFASFGEMSWD